MSSRTVGNNPDTSTPCPTCGKPCKNKAGLTSHMNMMHLELSPSQAAHMDNLRGTGQALAEAPTLQPLDTSPEQPYKSVEDLESTSEAPATSENKCLYSMVHDWRVSSDQSDTGKYGVREQCFNCNKIRTEFNPELHATQAQPKTDEVKVLVAKTLTFAPDNEKVGELRARIDNMTEAIHRLIREARISEVEFLERLKLEFDANIGEGGDKWSETDAADMVNKRLAELKRSL